MKKNTLLILSLLLTGCLSTNSYQPVRTGVVPAKEYSERIKAIYSKRPQQTQLRYQYLGSVQFKNGRPEILPALSSAQAKASIRFVKDLPPEERGKERASKRKKAAPLFNKNNKIVTNMDNTGSPSHYGVDPLRPRAYQGPLPFGDPGISSSLWQEGAADNNLFRDFRAFRVMDLVTIIVSEESEGKKEAKTDIKKENSFLSGIANFFNFEKDLENRNSGLDSSKLINTNLESELKGTGKTNRKGSLKAKISAMVVEVLPSGVMRIEGEKIISVDNEEQIMVISGLVRPQDVNEDNEVDSSKIANMRIDFYGVGNIADAQRSGWLQRFIEKIWPF
ncbi:MAG: flagellar basal body L-ring protein FlgH [Candidatus Dadabacteria bacterium]|nr:MAG: flagellar basal body L-ring protein FlgH [Candidatus Dadabacteria bacterium]